MPESLDPIKATDTNTQFVINHLYDGLVSWSLENGIEPLLAEKWKFSVDKKNIYFDLKQNAYFSDGTQITAPDIVTCLTRVLTTENYYKDHFKNVSSLTAVSLYKVRIELKRQDPKILFLLAGTPALITKIDKHGTFLSSGPFAINKIDKNEISIVARKNYYGIQPTTEIINFRILRDNNILKMIDKNEIDDSIIDSSPNQNLRTKKDNWTKINMWATWGIGFDIRNTVAKNKIIRQALAKNLKSETFINQIFPNQQLAYGLIPFGIPGTLTNSVPLDVDLKFKIPLNEKESQTIEIYIPIEIPQKEQIINWLNKNAEISLVKYKIIEENFAKIISYLGTGKMGAFLLSFNAEYPSPYFYLDSILSTGPSNFFGVDSVVINNLFTAFDSTKEPASNAEALKKINSYIIAESYFIPLMHIKHNAWARDCVSGIQFTPLSEGYFSLRKVKNSCRR